MNEDPYQRLVEEHYKSKKEPLLLSEFGKYLRKAGLWPREGEKRSLVEFIEASSKSVLLKRDPRTPAFVVVVPKDREEIAEAAIQLRHRLQFLVSLPRPLLLAFCVNARPEIDVFVQREPPYRYQVGQVPNDPSYVPIEREFRNSGLYIGDPRHLDSEDVKRLTNSISNWAKTHSVPLSELPDNSSLPRKSAVHNQSQPPKPASSPFRMGSNDPPGLPVVVSWFG